MSDLRYANEKVQYSAQICSFIIKSIPQESGFTPVPSEGFRQVAEFVYHYENFCFRAYAFREKVLKFINAVLVLGFDDHDVKIKFIKNSPSVIDAKLLAVVEKFDDKKALGKVIEDRNSLTHRLYYSQSFDHFLRPKTPLATNEAEFRAWCHDWKREVMSRSKLTEICTKKIFDMNHELATKIVAHKEAKKSK